MLKKSFYYYLGDASIKIGAGLIAGSMVAVSVAGTLKSITGTGFVVALFFLVVGYYLRDSRRKFIRNLWCLIELKIKKKLHQKNLLRKASPKNFKKSKKGLYTKVISSKK